MKTVIATIIGIVLGFVVMKGLIGVAQADHPPFETTNKYTNAIIGLYAGPTRSAVREGKSTEDIVSSINNYMKNLAVCIGFDRAALQVVVDYGEDQLDAVKVSAWQERFYKFEAHMQYISAAGERVLGSNTFPGNHRFYQAKDFSDQAFAHWYNKMITDENAGTEIGNTSHNCNLLNDTLDGYNEIADKRLQGE